jgi:hypothetical protein
VDASVRSDDACNMRGQIKQRPAVVSAAETRDHFPAEASNLAIGQNGLKAVADFDAIPSVANREQDQHAAIGAFWTDSPALV